jgi:hypothetical protein
MIKRVVEAAVLPALLVLIPLSYAAPAAATDMAFCSGDCGNIHVINRADVVVTDVVVRQLADSANICAAAKKTHKANLGKQGTSPYNESAFDIKVDRQCAYRVKFNTTKGCVGNKDKKITPDEIADDKTQIVLHGRCGTLKVDQRKPREARG